MAHSTRKHPKKILKRTGEKELFVPEKLCGSILVTGAPEHLAEQVCSIVSDSIQSGMSTDKIFTMTRSYLSDLSPKIAALYALDRGLGALGPSGFLFEQYVAALFQEMGYTVKNNVYVSGEGVEHEIDIWAEKGNVVYIIEAKYRNDFKAKTHINTVMYADARLNDIRRRAIKEGDTREYYIWVVTNTQFTDAAINYVAYRDVQLMGWDYPKYINLMKIVSDKKLYPVTILPSITLKVLKALAADNIVLIKSLRGYSADTLQTKYGMSRTLAVKLEKE
ncbi:restriction endonuclease, partial [Patescibacteria group bacterium]|nr:restriction endonuclease [Patescibacteria group bacterium]